MTSAFPMIFLNVLLRDMFEHKRPEAARCRMGSHFRQKGFIQALVFPWVGHPPEPSYFDPNLRRSET